MLARTLDLAMRELAACQHGVVGVSQARQLVPGRAAYRSCLRSGRWVRDAPSILRLAGSPGTFAQACMSAVLDSGDGSAASHMTAAALWGLPGFSPGPVQVSRLRGRNHRKTSLAVVHEPRSLPGHHVTVIDRIPVTTAARTVFDLAGNVHPLRAERALDNALARRLFSLEAMRRIAIELLERGRAGSALVRQLLEARGAGYIPPASGLEASFFSLLVQAGVALPERQVDLGGDEWIGRVDYFYRRARLVIEIDSDRHHTAKLDRESDARRDTALRAAGFRVLRITETQLKERPYEVLDQVRSALEPAA